MERNDPRVSDDPRWRYIEDDDDMTGAIEAIDNDLPDLGALIPEPDQGRGGQIRPREDEDSMERAVVPRGDGDIDVAGARAMPGGGNQVSKETPISQYPSLTYGLQETHTTILPWVGWCAVAMDKASAIPVKMSLRMNSIWDMFPNAITASPGDGDPFTTPGMYGKPTEGAGIAASNVRFPRSMAAGTNANERPQWRDYWVQLYEYYTVLGCEYELVIENPTELAGGSVLVAHEFDSYSDVEGASGNVMPVTSIEEIMNFKGIRYENVGDNSFNSGNGNVKIIKGTYKPGQIKRNIVNDGDVKTWTKTGSALPNMKEFLQVLFVKHPMAYANTGYAVNVQIKLKYIVQFKDLRKQARYPNTAVAGTITQSITSGVGDQVRQVVG